MIKTETACHYLFEKEASEIFNTSKLSEDFINESLDTLRKVNITFLSRETNDGFPFIDPLSFTNNCHLFSLLGAEIKKNYKGKSEEEKLAKTQENRLLDLSFLLSYTFLKERNLLCQVIEAAEKKGEVTLPTNKKLFYSFVKDSEGALVRNSRLSLNKVFESCIKEKCLNAKDRSLIHKELYQLSLEDLTLLPERGSTPLYTPPKLFGVAILIHENIPFVIKTKVLTSEGTGTLFYQSAPVKGDEPVIIFEAIASDDLDSVSFRNMAETCPSYFERKPSSKARQRHKDSCRFCTETKADIRPYQERFEKATESIQDCLYALGADFMRELQKPHVKFFEDKEKYPELNMIFQKAICNIDRLKLSMNHPLAFTVNHVYLDNAEHALSSEFRMNSSPETFLKQRGFL